MLNKPRFLQRLQRFVIRLWTTVRSAGLRAAFSYILHICLNLLADRWSRFWMRFAGLSRFGRFSMRLASWSTPPYKARVYLSWLSPEGYIAPSAILYHSDLRLGKHVFIGDRVLIYQHSQDGGPVQLGERAHLWGDCLLETGEGGSITVGAGARLNRGVQLISYKAPIHIGRDAGLGTNATFHSYDHGTISNIPYVKQPLQTKGPIVVGEHAWVGAGVIVSSGVRIGNHAVVAAGSVVTHDVPDGAIVAGVPARIVKMRSDLVDNGAAAPLENH